MTTKHCKKCNQDKLLMEFARNPHGALGLHSRCRSCQRSAANKYYTENRDAHLAKVKQYAKDPNNKLKIKALRQNWLAQPHNRLAKRLRTQMWHALRKYVKSAATEKLVGLSFREFKEYLEKQFTENMSWDNRDSFHIDHYIPCSFFDLSDPIQQAICFCYLNLRPLSPQDNLSKRAALPEDYRDRLETIKKHLGIEPTFQIGRNEVFSDCLSNW